MSLHRCGVISQVIITNIQRFSLHDGPGIRTTVFMKGCLLRCPWCSNPENLNPNIEEYNKDGQSGVYGREYTTDEIYNELIKDKVFYEPNGGVTFSGGEALLQADRLEPLLKRLKTANITVAIETSLLAPSDNLQLVLPYVDFFYVDMKIMDASRFRKVIRGNFELYNTNLELLANNKKFVVRIPVIGSFTDDTVNRKLIASAIKHFKNSIIKVELIKGHNLGETKYRSLSLEIPQYTVVDDGLLVQYKEEIEAIVVDIPVEICKI